jgi:hypothetical protein
MPRPSALRIQLLAAVLVLNGACLCNTNAPPPVPEGIQEQVHWFWTNGDSADDNDLRDAAAKLATAANATTWTQPVKGQSSAHLDAMDVMGFETDTSNDPAVAKPLLVVNEFDCTQAQLEKVLLNDDQSDQFPGDYSKYVRTDSYDRSQWDAKTINMATWSNEIDISFPFPVNDSDTSTVKGSLRRIPKQDATFAQSDVLIARTYLPAPAVFPQGSGNYYKQDYEIEIYWEQSPGKMFHVYGMWRDVKLAGFTLNDGILLNDVLDNLVNWDGTVQQLCAKQ